MAISQGSTVLQSDIKSKYDSFNAFITNYGGTIAKLTVPGQNTTVYASQFNAMNNKINEFKNDTYLKTQSSWWVAGPTVTAGTSLLDDANFTNINTTISNFSKVKCRNNTYNSHSTRSHSTNNNSPKSHSTNSNEWNYNHLCINDPPGWSDGVNSEGWEISEKKSNGTCKHGTCTAYGNCTSNGTCKNKTFIDITKAHTNA